VQCSCAHLRGRGACLGLPSNSRGISGPCPPCFHKATDPLPLRAWRFSLSAHSHSLSLSRSPSLLPLTLTLTLTLELTQTSHPPPRMADPLATGPPPTSPTIAPPLSFLPSLPGSAPTYPPTSAPSWAPYAPTRHSPHLACLSLSLLFAETDLGFTSRIGYSFPSRVRLRHRHSVAILVTGPSVCPGA